MKRKYSIKRLFAMLVVSWISSLIFFFGIYITIELAYLIDIKFVLWLGIFWVILILWMYHFKIIEKYLIWVLSKTRLLYPEDRL